MPDFVQRLQVLRGARFEFLLWAVASFGGSFITYLWGQAGIPVWISGWVVLVWLLVLFVIILLNAERRVADAEKDAAKGDLEAVLRRETMEHRDTSSNLLNAVVRNSSRSLRTVTEHLRARAGENSRNDGLKLMTEDEAKVLQREMLRQIFHDLRAVFEGDTRGVDTTTYPPNFLRSPCSSPPPRQSMQNRWCVYFGTTQREWSQVQKQGLLSWADILALRMFGPFEIKQL